MTIDEQASIVSQTAEHVRQQLAGDSTGHDWWHVYRVRRIALRLLETEPAHRFIVELGALLHDIADWKFHNGDVKAGSRVARAWLERCGAEPTAIERVCEIVEHASFKGAGVATRMRSLEGMIVQDADRLDALGAIGIARAFAYGGAAGRNLHAPGLAPQPHATFQEYRTGQTTTINHFYEKLLLLKDRMNTDAARRLAEHRHAAMEAFLAEFFAEWDGSDSPL
jgi:uncharacterized protein